MAAEIDRTDAELADHASSTDLLDVIDRLYAVAVEPTRYAELVESWTHRIAHATQAPFSTFRHLTVAGHVERASEILERLSTVSRQGPAGPMLNSLSVDANATMVISRDGRILEANPSARAAFSLPSTATIDDLPIESIYLEDLRVSLSGAASWRPIGPLLVRARHRLHDRLVLIQLQPLPTATSEGLFLALTSEVAWSASLGSLLSATFGLTQAELEVLEAITRGATATELAHHSGRSEATVRTHIRSLLAKTEARSQTELIRVTLGLLDVVSATPMPSPAQNPLGEPYCAGYPRNDYRSFMLPDGRRYDYYKVGHPAGTPVVWLPGDLGMGRLPLAIERRLLDIGITLVVPVRAGYGWSSQPPTRAPIYDVILVDLLAWLDHLRLPKAVVVTIGSDARIGFALANRAPERVAGLIAVGAVMPAIEPRHYARMHLWHRFICANGRFAPKVLPFLMRAGYLLAQRIGRKAFAEAIFADSPPDLEALADPAFLPALLTGAEIVLSEGVSAHRVMGQEIAAFQVDWSELLASITVPVTLFNGHHDAETHIDTVREYVEAYPHLKLVDFPDEGRFVYARKWSALETCIRNYQSVKT